MIMTISSAWTEQAHSILRSSSQRQPYMNILFLGAAACIIFQGVTARELTLRPRRSGGGPVTFKPKWYHRVLIVLVGVSVGGVSVWSLVGSP